MWPHLRDSLRPAPQVPGTAWSTLLDDPRLGEVRLTGRIDHLPGARGLVVIVHGMGGNADRPYCAQAAAEARAAGYSSLRLNLRGADGSGEDFYHVGLVEDLVAALAHPEVARYQRLYALGFSLGGHVVLRHVVLSGRRAGVRAVAAMCAPIDLEAGVRSIDLPRRWPYRRHLLSGVKECYRQVALRRSQVPLPVEALARIQTVRAWDDQVVAPRFGFADASDYYRQVGVGDLLPALEVPALYVGGVGDPMVPRVTVQPALARASRALEVRWLSGGHVGFPAGIRVLRDIMAWLARH